MNLTYVGQAHIFVDELGKQHVMTLELAKEASETISQDIPGKGRVEICNAATKAREALKGVMGQEVE